MQTKTIQRTTIHVCYLQDCCVSLSFTYKNHISWYKSQTNNFSLIKEFIWQVRGIITLFSCTLRDRKFILNYSFHFITCIFYFVMLFFTSYHKATFTAAALPSVHSTTPQSTWHPNKKFQTSFDLELLMMRHKFLCFFYSCMKMKRAYSSTSCFLDQSESEKDRML